jgi:hypothetical protein
MTCFKGVTRGERATGEALRALLSRPFCPCESRQVDLWYLPARWRDTTPVIVSHRLAPEKPCSAENKREQGFTIVPFYNIFSSPFALTAACNRIIGPVVLACHLHTVTGLAVRISASA